MLKWKAARLRQDPSLCAFCRHRLTSQSSTPSSFRSFSSSPRLHDDNSNGKGDGAAPTSSRGPAFGAKASFGASFGSKFGASHSTAPSSSTIPDPPKSSADTDSATEYLSTEERQARERLIARRKEAEVKVQPAPARPVFRHNFNAEKQRATHDAIQAQSAELKNSKLPPNPFASRGVPLPAETGGQGLGKSGLSNAFGGFQMSPLKRRPLPASPAQAERDLKSTPEASGGSQSISQQEDRLRLNNGFSGAPPTQQRAMKDNGFSRVPPMQQTPLQGNGFSRTPPAQQRAMKDNGFSRAPPMQQSPIQDNGFSRTPPQKQENIQTSGFNELNRVQSGPPRKDDDLNSLATRSGSQDFNPQTTWGHLKKSDNGFQKKLETSGNSKPDEFRKILNKMKRPPRPTWGGNNQRASKSAPVQPVGDQSDPPVTDDLDISINADVDLSGVSQPLESWPEGPERRRKGDGKKGKGRDDRLEIDDEGEKMGDSRGKPIKKDKGRDKGRSKKSSRSDRFEIEDMEDDVNDTYVDQEALKAERKARRSMKEEASRGPKPIVLPELISITALADGLSIEPEEFLAQLGEMGFEGVSLDSMMTGETAALVAQEYGFEPTVYSGSRDLKPLPPPEDMSVVPPRPPVVTIMGHVDHGKTTLLDYLRKSSVAAQEHGGITQHIGAFSVKMSTGKQITFLDTPGHAAFLSMRERGANVTDLVILVVAADDSVKPQTIEALKHARGSKVPIIVAITKIDREGANVDRVKNDLSTNGVEIEDFGGDVQVVCVSGKTGEGMDDLEENILTLSEILDMRAEADGLAEGWILESSLKPVVGKAATILVRRGTLRPGDHIAAGLTWAKIRHLRNEAGVDIDEAPPGTPVEILGWRDLPEAGDEVLQAPDEGTAKNAVDYRIEIHDRERDAAAHQAVEASRRVHQEKRAREKEAAANVDAADLAHIRYYQRKSYAAMQAKQIIAEEDAANADEGGPKTVNFVVKGDVHGSVEAICAAIQEIGTHEVSPKVLRSAAGPISEFDVEHASMSNSVIVNFSVAIPPYIKRMAEEQGVKIMDHTVIYHLIDDVKSELSKLLPPDISQHVLGEAEILQIFPINVKGRQYMNIAGCRVRNGAVSKNDMYRIFRGKEQIFDGSLSALKNVKKDVMEMKKGAECGMSFEGYQDMQVGDQIQAYKEISTPRSL